MRRSEAAVLALAGWLSGASVARAADTARLPEPAYPGVLQLLETGQVARALEKLEAELGGVRADWPIEALVLRAALLERAGRAGESAAVWDAVAAREPALAAFAHRRSLEALVAAADVPQVLARLGPLSNRRTAGAHDDLYVVLAERLRRAGDAKGAADLMRRVLATAPAPRVADRARLELAAALEATGEVARALEVLREVERHTAEASVFARARDERRRLAEAAGAALAPLAESDYRTIAARLAAAARFADALDVLDAWRRAYPRSPHLDEIEAGRIEMLFRLRANAEARAGIAAFERTYPASPALGRVRVVAFRLDVREGRTPEVERRGRALLEGRGARLSPAAKEAVGVTLANYLVSVGAVGEGLSVYRELFRQTRDARARIDLLLRAGVAALRAGELARAEANLRGVLARRPSPAVDLTAAYWLAVAEHSLGRRTDAVARWRGLVARAPFSYTGRRAAERLAALGEAPPVPPPLVFPDPVLSPATAARPEYRAATVLAKAGLLAPAAAAARDLATRAPRDPAAALLAARAAAAAGDHRAALAALGGRLSPYLQRPSAGAPPDLLRLAYPLAFWTEVEPRARTAGVDPLLLAAIMRRESRFDPAVVSPAGAIGLFQIMPYTAAALAAETGREEAGDEALLAPPANAELAARLVGRLARQFDGHVVAIAAAFNAGEDRVQVWWDAARGLSEDLFVETIPYAETRAYVKEVYANYEMYKALYRQSP